MKFKYGMTLAETLLVFIIIGIVASVTIVSVKPWEKSYKHIYSRVYNALGLTIYNDMVEKGKFPETSTDFCKSLLNYMNTSNNAKDSDFCKEANDVGATPTFAPDYYSSTNDAGVTNNNQPIHLSNGSYIWFAGNHNKKTCGSTNNKICPFEYTLGTSSVKFYLVFADLNGEAAPNSAEYVKNVTKTKNPDIVAFAVTDKFTVVPMGYQMIDMKYLQAHYIFPSDSDDAEDIVSDPMAFRAAQILAFGTGTPDEENCTSKDAEGNVIISDCETIQSTSNPLTLELQEAGDLGWVDSDKKCKAEVNSPFCVNWDGTTAKKAILRVVKNSDGENVPLTYDEMYIHESCKGSSSSEPICDVKIYDYH